MRKPNGYGSIKHLSGNRRRPFVFVISKDGRQRPVEYFVTQVEAEVFAADYNRLHNRPSLPGHKPTFAEMYTRWLAAHTADTEPSQSTLDSYANAYKHCASITQKVFTQHNGTAFYESRASSDNVLSSFTLYVSDTSTSTASDANWLAIGY